MMGCVEITFRQQRLRKTFSSEREIRKEYGNDMTRTIMRRLAVLNAAPTLTQVPIVPPLRRHLLSGAGKEQYAPAHRGGAVREYLRRPGLGLRLVNLPGYSPDFNADEAIWGWAREEATGNLCLGSRAAVQERVGSFLARLISRKDEVKRRCRTVLQSRAESLRETPSQIPDFRQMHIPPWLWFRL